MGLILTLHFVVRFAVLQDVLQNVGLWENLPYDWRISAHVNIEFSCKCRRDTRE